MSTVDVGCVAAAAAIATKEEKAAANAATLRSLEELRVKTTAATVAAADSTKISDSERRSTASPGPLLPTRPEAQVGTVASTPAADATDAPMDVSPGTAEEASVREDEHLKEQGEWSLTCSTLAHQQRPFESSHGMSTGLRGWGMFVSDHWDDADEPWGAGQVGEGDEEEGEGGEGRGARRERSRRHRPYAGDADDSGDADDEDDGGEEGMEGGDEGEGFDDGLLSEDEEECSVADTEEANAVGSQSIYTQCVPCAHPPPAACVRRTCSHACTAGQCSVSAALPARAVATGTCDTLYKRRGF